MLRPNEFLSLPGIEPVTSVSIGIYTTLMMPPPPYRSLMVFSAGKPFTEQGTSCKQPLAYVSRKNSCARHKLVSFEIETKDEKVSCIRPERHQSNIRGTNFLPREV